VLLLVLLINITRTVSHIHSYYFIGSVTVTPYSHLPYRTP